MPNQRALKRRGKEEKREIRKDLKVSGTRAEQDEEQLMVLDTVEAYRIL